jgi:hypothetical protein
VPSPSGRSSALASEKKTLHGSLETDVEFTFSHVDFILKQFADSPRSYAVLTRDLDGGKLPGTDQAIDDRE